VITNELFDTSINFNYYYENPKYEINYEKPHFHEARIMSFKQIRDIFFQLLNVSMNQSRIRDCEGELEKL